MTKQPVRNRSAYVADYQTTQDFLNFDDFGPALEEILRDAQTPLTVGLFGAWGSGKTSLLSMLREKLDNSDPRRQIRTVCFTAWKYDRQDALWRAFILRVLDALYPRATGSGPREARPLPPLEQLTDAEKEQIQLPDRLQESVYRPVDWQELGKLVVDWRALLLEGSEGALEVAEALLPVPGLVRKLKKLLIGEKGPESDVLGLAGGIRREVHEYHRQQLASMEQFEATFAEVLKLVLGAEGRLVVFVDDLDRCLPEKAIEVLEAIKLFLEAPGVVFVLGMDREVIERGVESRYRGFFRQAAGAGPAFPISGDTYLQKIVQIPFHLPPLAVEDVERFIASLDNTNDAVLQLSAMTRAVFARGLYPNPRQVKRALNIFRLLRAIALRREGRDVLPANAIAWPLLAKTIVIQSQYPELYQAWRRYPTLVQTLESEYASRPSDEEEVVRGRLAAPDAEAALAQAAAGERAPMELEARRTVRSGGLLAPYLENRQRYALLEQMLCFPEEAATPDDLRQLARFSGLSRAQMLAYVRLAGTVETAVTPAALLEAPAELLDNMLSGDRARVLDAVGQVQEQAPAADAPLRQAMQQALMAEIVNPQREVVARASAGQALGLLGDLRPGVG